MDLVERSSGGVTSQPDPAGSQSRSSTAGELTCGHRPPEPRGARLPEVYNSPEQSFLRRAADSILALFERNDPSGGPDAAKGIMTWKARQEGLTLKEYQEQVGAREGVGTRLGKSALAGAVGVGSGLLGAGAALFEARGLEAASQKLDSLREDLMSANPSFVDQVAAGVGSTALFFIPGVGVARGAQALQVASGMARWLGAGASAGMEASAEAGSVYNSLKQSGASDEDARRGAATTFFANAALTTVTNRFGLFNAHENPVVRRTLSAAYEGLLQEGPQQMIANLATDKPVMDGVKDAVLVGTVAGGLVGGGGVQPKSSQEGVNERGSIAVTGQETAPGNREERVGTGGPSGSRQTGPKVPDFEGIVLPPSGMQATPVQQQQAQARGAAPNSPGSHSSPPPAAASAPLPSPAPPAVAGEATPQAAFESRKTSISQRLGVSGLSEEQKSVAAEFYAQSKELTKAFLKGDHQEIRKLVVNKLKQKFGFSKDTNDDQMIDNPTIDAQLLEEVRRQSPLQLGGVGSKGKEGEVVYTASSSELRVDEEQGAKIQGKNYFLVRGADVLGKPSYTVFLERYHTPDTFEQGVTHPPSLSLQRRKLNSWESSLVHRALESGDGRVRFRGGQSVGMYDFVRAPGGDYYGRRIIEVSSDSQVFLRGMSVSEATQAFNQPSAYEADAFSNSTWMGLKEYRSLGISQGGRIYEASHIPLNLSLK